ncbi:DUF2237 domain-containing protein [Paraglaciecola sp. 25GB23A]|jgi:hypothetical protein|uniref:DUF2237 family protein n=1 Tax=Paraglaciecola sp. 25GB23A TaxID=3156068 RepID=UPI0032AFEC91
MANEKNVLGKPLKLCCGNGGYTREGFCYVPASDSGNHSVCAIVTEEFLVFSKSQGNDLSTPIKQYHFDGLKAGDRWCLCAARWQEAFNAGKAPQVVLSATNEACLAIIKLADLQTHAVEELS